MIQFFNVFKNYHSERAALCDINLQIRRGEFVFVTGPSGAGKTTFLRLIFGAEQATRGQILVNGINLARARSATISHLRRRVGVIFQDFKLLYDRPALDNVLIPLDVVGMKTREAKRRAWWALEAVGLKEKIHEMPEQLSGGEQQRVAIARAIVNNPAILLADEPTGNLDQDLTLEIFSLLRDINKKGKTVVVASHDEESADRFAHRKIILDQGEIVAESNETELPVYMASHQHISTL